MARTRAPTPVDTARSPHVDLPDASLPACAAPGASDSAPGRSAVDALAVAVGIRRVGAHHRGAGTDLLDLSLLVVAIHRKIPGLACTRRLDPEVSADREYRSFGQRDLAGDRIFDRFGSRRRLA